MITSVLRQKWRTLVSKGDAWRSMGRGTSERTGCWWLISRAQGVGPMSPRARLVLALGARGTGLLALGSRGPERSCSRVPRAKTGRTGRPVNWPPASGPGAYRRNAGRTPLSCVGPAR
jgi:hypothetical protein